MNGEEKEEAHRPRPLSAGIWTLFSWLRRSERSSSSESVSSIGSARTAVSFDFLAPGNYSFSSTPIVVTTPLSPPSDTYKKRLQERNLRRQRDRDVTLHRKYGLFREHGHVYDGYTLPPLRRAQGNTVDRSNRERRATSESLQRRAAYVPGKRRAPLPPTIATSASLPRTYKRKRPAPKPPIKNTVKSNNNIKLIDNPVQMTSNTESGVKHIPDHELLDTKSSKKCDTNKKDAAAKDTKSKTDKSFLKNIFENKKRSSVIETTSVRLLPSISELDKQATEIIENKKLQQKINSVRTDDENNSKNLTTLYEGNSWFCTSCLRKYSSSVKSCDSCSPDKRHSLQKNGFKIPFPRSSIYTQTNNGETSSPSRNSMDERKVLKEILKEMKDSLPKKSKDNKVNSILTEIPTLRIGSTVHEAYKDITTQPSSSSKILEDKKISTSLLTKTDEKIEHNGIMQPSLPGVQSSNLKSKQLQITSAFENKTEVLSSRDNHRKENCSNNSPIFASNVRNNLSGINATNVTENKNHETSNLKDSTMVQNVRQTKSEETNKTVVHKSKENSNNILLDNHQQFVKKKILMDYMDKSQNQTPTSSVTNKSELVVPKSSNLQFSDFPKSHAVVVNSVTVTTSRSISETSKNRENINPESNLHMPLKISSLLNPVYIPNKNAVKENISIESHTSKDPKKELPSNSKAQKIINNEKNALKINQTENDIAIPTNSLIPKSLNIGSDSKEPKVKETVKIESQAEIITVKDDTSEQKVMPSTSRGSNSVQILNDNMGKLGHYDQRRHLINQLEQSIAKGDELAAAEAAAKLAKLKLSCSVLSFSSQILGETKTKQNERNTRHNLSDTSASSSKDEQNVPQVKTGEIVEPVDINSHGNKSKLIEIKKVSEGTSTRIISEPKLKTQSTSNPSPSNQVIAEDIIPINVWIEDKQAARGPMRLHISRRATVADLRRQAEHSLGLATPLQRWIIGRTLCSDDTSPLVSVAGPLLRAPFYLCIVQPDNDDKPVTKEVNTIQDNDTKNDAAGKSGDFYTELMNLEKQSLIPNTEPFECGVCMEECAAGAGVILRECIHSFCRECLSDVVQHSQEPVVACPAMGCSGHLQEREIRTIVTPEEYERWLARGLATAECGTRNAFHCRTRDCTGWALCDPGVRRFPCPVCKSTNCVQCQAIHKGETCEQYQTKLRQAVTAAETNKDDEGTQALLNSLIAKGEALECPECRAIITKKWGCDWVKCSACKTEICWVTKGRRWGPGGRGDTTGGCRCGVDGQRCHPSCGYCH